MPSQHVDLSIVIVNYNTRDALNRCLKSICKFTGGLSVQIIVIDNASKDGSAEMVSQQKPDITLIASKVNSWFTGGNNQGLQLAEGEYVLFLNPDTVVQPDTLASMLAYLRKHSRVGAIACQMRSLEGRVQFTGSEMPRYLDLLLGYTFLGIVFLPWRNARRKRMWYTGWDRNTTRSVGVIADSCLMAPLALLRQIGGFDEAFKLYFTEDDLCQRIHAAGYETHFVADTFLLHEEHVSTHQTQRRATQTYYADLLVFSRKYYGTMSSLALALLAWPTFHGMQFVQWLRGDS